MIWVKQNQNWEAQQTLGPELEKEEAADICVISTLLASHKELENENYLSTRESEGNF